MPVTVTIPAIIQMVAVILALVVVAVIARWNAELRSENSYQARKITELITELINLESHHRNQIELARSQLEEWQHRCDITERALQVVWTRWRLGEKPPPGDEVPSPEDLVASLPKEVHELDPYYRAIGVGDNGW